MDFLYRDQLPNAAIINDRIRNLNHIIHAVSQWREPPLDSQWPVLVKDNIAVSGLRATSGSYALKELKSNDAFCIKKLREHGGLPFGKTTMSELAGYLSSKMPPGYSELGGQGINPIDPSLSPGGSSSGSAIAVAAGFCHSAIGTETHGSIVIPSMACGIVGIKPSVGMISREGVVPISHSLDTPGAMAQTVEEAAKLLEALCGQDPEDEATAVCPDNVDFHTALGENKELIKLALAIPDYRAFDDEERKVLTKFVDAVRRNNIELVEVPIKNVETYYRIISSTEIQGPYGMDRITGALAYSPDLDNEVYKNALKKGIGNCTEAIDLTVKQAQAQAIICVGFTPWWAVGRAPYVALPLAQRANHAMIGITVGARRLEDRKVIDIAARLEKVIRQIF